MLSKFASKPALYEEMGQVNLTIFQICLAAFMACLTKATQCSQAFHPYSGSRNGGDQRLQAIRFTTLML